MNFNNNCVLSYIKDDSKRLRKINAIKLPEDLSQSLIPKYVVYYKECYNREKLLFREFFKIEKHPKLANINRVFTSSKSNKIHILEKLDQIKFILDKIENLNIQELISKKQDISMNIGEKTGNISEKPEKKHIKLPKYLSFKKHEKDEKKYYLIYDKKIHNKKRETFKLVYNIDQDISLNLADFLKKIKDKFE